MRTTIKGKNIEVPARDRAYAERKVGRLERLLDDRSEAVVEFSVESHRSADTSHIVDVTLAVNRRTLRGTGHAATHRAAIDEVVDKLERQVVTHKDRPLEKRRLASRRTESVPSYTAGDRALEDVTEKARVVKIKRFAIEPMFEEDAVARMKELGHSFFIFVNAENERLAVLYRRSDGDYGLIEPAIGGQYTPDSHRARKGTSTRQ